MAARSNPNVQGVSRAASQSTLPELNLRWRPLPWARQSSEAVPDVEAACLLRLCCLPARSRYGAKHPSPSIICIITTSLSHLRSGLHHRPNPSILSKRSNNILILALLPSQQTHSRALGAIATRHSPCLDWCQQPACWPSWLMRSQNSRSLLSKPSMTILTPSGLRSPTL